MEIIENAPLAPHTTLKIGGSARYLCRVESIESLRRALAFARARSLPFFILGGGSNVLVSDEGFAGLVIKMGMKGIEFSADLVTAAAGEPWDDLVAETVKRGAWGLENLSLVPGTVGAAPVQNIGAYGVEVKDLVESVRVIDALTGEERTMANAECRFAYRESVFKRPESKSLIIVSVAFRLSQTSRPNLSYKDLRDLFADRGAGASAPSQVEIRDAVIKIRTGKFPDLSQIGTAGSFWKNPIISKGHYEKLRAEYPAMPGFIVGADGSSAIDGAAEDLQTARISVKVPLAWILDNVCGLKGYAKGNVALFQKQPLVLVAKPAKTAGGPGATASEVAAFAAEVKDLVKAKTAIDIEPEVGFLS